MSVWPSAAEFFADCDHFCSAASNPGLGLPDGADAAGAAVVGGVFAVVGGDPAERVVAHIGSWSAPMLPTAVQSPDRPQPTAMNCPGVPSPSPVGVPQIPCRWVTTAGSPLWSWPAATQLPGEVQSMAWSPP